jgi:hypothetical protein
MDDEQLERMASGRVYAPTGVMRYVTIALLVAFIAVVMVAMAWLIIS